MQHTTTEPEYTIEYHGVTIKCQDVESVVETVKALVPLEREVPVPTHDDAATDALPVANANPVATAMYTMYRETPTWRRPVEIVKALRKYGVRTRYANVYAVLRYGDFVKREGRWNVKDAAGA